MVYPLQISLYIGLYQGKFVKKIKTDSEKILKYCKSIDKHVESFLAKDGMYILVVRMSRLMINCGRLFMKIPALQHSAHICLNQYYLSCNAYYDKTEHHFQNLTDFFDFFLVSKVGTAGVAWCAVSDIVEEASSASSAGGSIPDWS